ncbi:endochitinase A-like [Ixodes scapularis]|uniref:endochitinase A-like n=1 Tax=Ixodes scapularis TaxID=6945 RepID=UPI001A9FD800|nr:endochitinase A-like [Ixodes scapularis]
MEEIKEQILFKPTDHFSISSVFDENGGEPFPPRRKSLAAKRRTLDDELEDLREPSTSSSSSSDSQVQQTEPLPLSRADGWSSTMTNDTRPASSTPQITPSKSKFFEDATSIEPLEKKDTTSSKVSTPRRTTSQTPTQRAADPSAMFTPRRRSDWVPASTTLTPQIRLGATPTPKTRESRGAEAAQRKEATRSFDPTAVSPGVAATPRRETAIPITPARQMPNTRPESASMLWESRDFMETEKKELLEQNDRPFKNVTSTPTLYHTVSTPRNFSTTTSSPVVRPDPGLSSCRRNIPSSPPRLPRSIEPFRTPYKCMLRSPRSAWHTPNSYLEPTSTSQKHESVVLKEEEVNHADGQNVNLSAVAVPPHKDLSRPLLSNQNFFPKPNSSCGIHSEQRNASSPTRSLKHAVAEPVPESPKCSTGVETTLQRVIAIEEVGEGTHKSLRREDTDGARQSDGTKSSNTLTIKVVREGCRTCGRSTAKVEKACQTVPDYATAGKLLDDCTSPLA